MILLHGKWLYVSTMKCATNSLYNALQLQVERATWAGGGNFHGIPKTRMAPLHWTVVRNPYDRAVSIWHSTCVREENQHRYQAFSYIESHGGDPLDYSDFVDLILVRQPTLANPWLWANQSDWQDRFICDMSLNIEGLKEELLEQLGIDIELQRDNASEGREAWPAYYTKPVMLEKVQHWAGDDFDRFEYDR